MFRLLARVLVTIGLAVALGGRAAARAEPALPTAIFTVNSAADVGDAVPGNGVCETAPGNGLCTLRAAIRETNALGGAHSVVLPALPPGGSYLFTLAGGNEDAAAAGDLDITSQLTLQGGGAANTIIDANGAATGDRAFEIHAGAALTLTSVTVRRGTHTTAGGGLRNFGRLNLSDSVVISNTLMGTSTADTGGGLSNEPGAVSNIQRVVFQSNVSSGQGGGIWNGGTLTASTSLIVTNTAAFFGGGIHTDFGTTVIHHSLLERNAASGGGGFSLSGDETTVLHGTAVLSNTAEEGGGGLVYFGSDLVVRNSTFVGNASRDNGGGLYVTAQTTTTLMNVTVAENRAGQGFAGGGLYVTSGAVVNLRNSLVSFNFRPGVMFIEYSDCFGTITSQDYNLVRTLASCTIVGPDTPGLLGVAATGLGSLGQHGGPTPTLPLLANSNLVDAGNPAGCTDELGAPLLSDQRGFVPRATDGDGNGSAICDIGAFEFGAASPFTWLPLILR
jgi:CSLREA domain-containing protein